MSSSLFHASFAFAVSIPFLRICGLPPYISFVPAMISMLMDLDTSISPSARFEHTFHSLWALFFVTALPFAASMLSLDPCIAALPALAVTSHLFQDIISGEIDLGDELLGIGIAWTFMPRLNKVMDITSLPVALVLMFI